MANDPIHDLLTHYRQLNKGRVSIYEAPFAAEIQRREAKLTHVTALFHELLDRLYRGDHLITSEVLKYRMHLANTLGVNELPNAPDLRARLHDPNLEEYQHIKIIKANLLTPQQDLWLINHQYDLADILNGRFAVRFIPDIQSFFDDWNAKLGEIRYKGL